MAVPGQTTGYANCRLPFQIGAFDHKLAFIPINKIALSSKADHPRMCVFNYARSFPVTWQRWRSHQSIRHSKKNMLHADFMALCFIELELMPIEVLHFGNKDFRPFCSLTLARRLSYTNLARIRWRPIPVVPIWTSHVKAFESCRLTDRQTWPKVYDAASRVVKMLCFVWK